MKKISLLLITLSVCNSIFAQRNIEEVLLLQKPPNLYAIPKTNNPLTIDGRDDEKVWKNIPWSESFIDIEGEQKAKPLYDTKIKMLWDEQYLYIYARLEEPHIWGDITQHDAIIYHNNDFEVFLKPYENQSTYYEIEVNSMNTIMDLLMNKPYNIGGEAMLHWDTKGLKSAIHIEGTNNLPKDKDQYWAIEIAIPFTSIQKFGRKAHPITGEYWRLNFSRVQWQHDITNGKYSRKKVNGKLIPEDNWVWSPIGLVNMHYPQRWGYVQFIDEDSKPLQYPSSYNIERFTWNIFYLQKIFRQQHKKYSSDPTLLQENYTLLDDDLKKYSYELTMNKDQSFYKIEVKDLENSIFTSIDSEGNYTIKYDK